jgi:predicted nucleic acid-binding protein
MVLEGEVTTSVVSLFELECGAESDDQRGTIRALLREIAVSVLDADDVVEAAKIDRELRALGQRLETRDTLIAGVARSRNLALVTRNRRHFDRVAGLSVESPS